MLKSLVFHSDNYGEIKLESEETFMVDENSKGKQILFFITNKVLRKYSW